MELLIKEEVLLDQNLTAVDKIVYSILSATARNGVSYKPMRDIANMIGYSYETLYTAGKRLQAQGYISRSGKKNDRETVILK